MPDHFDAYHKWLGILPKDQPANAYRLLGLELYESDRDAIANAADRQMAHVRTFQNGPHAAESQKLLNQLAGARLLLLDAKRKPEYDTRLREQLAKAAAKSGLLVARPPAAPSLTPPPAPPVPPGSSQIGSNRPTPPTIPPTVIPAAGPQSPQAWNHDEESVLDEIADMVRQSGSSSPSHSGKRVGHSGIRAGRSGLASRSPTTAEKSHDNKNDHQENESHESRPVPAMLNFVAHPRIWAALTVGALSLSVLCGAVAARFWPKSVASTTIEAPKSTEKPNSAATSESSRKMAAAIKQWGGTTEIDAAQPERPIVTANLGLVKLDEDRFRQLGQLKSLKSLDLAITGAQDSWLESLSGLAQLETLDLASNSGITDAGMARLEALTQLKSLNLSGTKVSNAGLQQIQAKLPQLVVTDVLGELHAAGTNPRDAAFAQLGAKATSVGGTAAKLDRLAGPLADDDLKPLAQFPELTSADFRGGGIRGPGLKFLPKDSHLATLNLQFCPLDDTELQPLSKLDQLSQLDLGGTPLTGSSLSCLKPLTKLQRLSLCETMISDAALGSLSQLAANEVLNLRATKIGDAGLAQIKSLATLTRLNLAGTQITDAGLDHLAGLKKLTSLDLSGDQISPAAVAKLQQQLPNLTVIGPEDSPADDRFSPPALGPAVDWFAKLDPAKPLPPDASRGKWNKITDGIYSPLHANAVFPCDEPPKEYDLEVTVRRRQGDYGLVLIVPVAGKLVALMIDVEQGRSTYLESVNGGRYPNLFGTTCKPHLLSGDATHTLVCRVRQNGLCLFCDGHRALQWTGDPQLLSLPNQWSIAAPGYVSIGSQKTTYEFTRLEVRSASAASVVPPEVKPTKPVTPPLASSTRRPAPDEKALQQAMAEVQSVYKSDFTKAVTANARATLAELLVKRASETEDKPALRYALLRSAGELSLLAKTPAAMAKTADQMADEFAVSAAVVKANWILPVLNSADPSKGNITAQIKLALGVADELLELEQTTLAQSLVDRCKTLAEDVIGRQLHLDIDQATARVRVSQERRKLATQALETLKTAPDDPEANLAVGKYLCLVRHDWKAGLPRLAKCSDAELKKLALQDLKSPSDSKEQLALADAWWDYTPAAEENLPRGAKLRAEYWYRQTRENLKGVDLDKADRRIEEAHTLFKNANVAGKN